MKKILKIMSSWKVVLIIFVLAIIEFVLLLNWQWLTTRHISKSRQTDWITVSGFDIHLPEDLVVQRVDYYEATDRINAVYLMNKDYFFIISGIKDWDRSLKDTYVDNLWNLIDSKRDSDNYFFYGLDIWGDTSWAYHYLHGRFLYFTSENIFLQNYDLYFAFYGENLTIDIALEYLKEMIYYGEDEFIWQFIDYQEEESL